MILSTSLKTCMTESISSVSVKWSGQENNVHFKPKHCSLGSEAVKTGHRSFWDDDRRSSKVGLCVKCVCLWKEESLTRHMRFSQGDKCTKSVQRVSNCWRRRLPTLTLLWNGDKDKNSSFALQRSEWETCNLSSAFVSWLCLFWQYFGSWILSCHLRKHITDLHQNQLCINSIECEEKRWTFACLPQKICSLTISWESTFLESSNKVSLSCNA